MQNKKNFMFCGNCNTIDAYPRNDKRNGKAGKKPLKKKQATIDEAAITLNDKKENYSNLMGESNRLDPNDADNSVDTKVITE